MRRSRKFRQGVLTFFLVNVFRPCGPKLLLEGVSTSISKEIYTHLLFSRMGPLSPITYPPLDPRMWLQSAKAMARLSNYADLSGPSLLEIGQPRTIRMIGELETAGHFATEKNIWATYQEIGLVQLITRMP